MSKDCISRKTVEQLAKNIKKLPKDQSNLLSELLNNVLELNLIAIQMLETLQTMRSKYL